MLQRRVLEAEPAPPATHPPLVDVDRDAVLRQLERILASPLFKHSKRYPLLFRFVVERALEGRSHQLKERTLGVEVFCRDPDYDTNLDPVVRIAAGEIRKRIAQYYHEPGHEHEMRIDLPCGSYVPEFHPVSQPEVPPRFPNVAALLAPWPVSRRQRYIAAAALAVVLIPAAAWRWSGNTLERFWSPVWDSPGSILLCIGGAGLAPEPGNPPPPSTFDISVTDQIRREYVSFVDVTTLFRIAGLFQSRGKSYTMRIGAKTTFADLRDGPVVLIGGFNNGWTLRLLSQLRYSLVRDPVTRLEWIADRQNPSHHEWQVDTTLPNLKLTDDYAIISRVLDPATERMVVVAAGIVQYGTMAAGEFLTNPIYLEELSSHAPGNWRHMNMEAVIATKVVNGNSGPPRLLATHFW